MILLVFLDAANQVSYNDAKHGPSMMIFNFTWAYPERSPNSSNYFPGMFRIKID